jgi:predicted DNA binding protein
MATVMEFEIPADEFPLGSVFETLPGVTVELERLIPHDSMIIPYFWVRETETEDIEAAFDPHAGVNDIELIDSVETEHLLRAEWVREYVGVLSALSQFDIAVLSVRGTSEGWRFEVRGENREAIGNFHTYCQTNDIPIDITTVNALLSVSEEGYGLTETQREALIMAHEQGYFDSPREASLEEIASDLDITQQSLSSRIRRGSRRLVGSTLANE